MTNTPSQCIPLLLSALQCATTDTELTAALLLLPTLSLLTATQTELVWSSLPPAYLSRLAVSSLSSGKDSPLYARIFVSLLSSIRSSPTILHSPCYLEYSPLLARIGYGEGCAPTEVRQLSLECLECVCYVPECYPYMLQDNILITVVRGYSQHKGVSNLVLSCLQDSILFLDYSHQVVDMLHTQLSTCDQLEKYEYCDVISSLLTALSADSLPQTDSLFDLLGELFALMRNKVDTSRRLLSVRAASHLLSLYDIYSLCQCLSSDKGSFSLNTFLDMLLLLTNLILIDFKIWLDEYTQSGANRFTQALPQLSYSRQLLGLLERAEKDGCLYIKTADKCNHFVLSSLTAVQDISLSLMHLLITADQRQDVLPHTLSLPLLSLLGVFLSDHSLDKHTDILSVLSPILVQMLSKVPPGQLCAEMSKFDLSLLENANSLSSFLSNIGDNLTDSMLDFLPAALNCCQYPALSRRLSESGYYHLLLIYYSNLYILPTLSNNSTGIEPDNRCVILEILLTLSPHFTSLLPADSPILSLAAALLLTSVYSCDNGSEPTELECKLVSMLMKSVSETNFASSLPQHLAAALADITGVV